MQNQINSKGLVAAGLTACCMSLGLANENIRTDLASTAGLLSELRSPQAPPPLGISLDAEVEMRIKAEAGDKHELNSSSTYQSLRDRNIDFLRKCFREGHVEERLYALSVLTSYGRGEFDSLVPFVVEQLDDPNPAVVGTALEAIDYLISRDELLNNSLISTKIGALVSSEDIAIRNVALGFLRWNPIKLELKNEMLLRDLVLNDPSSYVRSQAMNALGASLGGKDDLTKLLMQVVTRDEALRWEALNSLEEAPGLERSDLSLLGGLLVSAPSNDIDSILGIFRHAGSSASSQFEALSLTLAQNQNCDSKHAFLIGQTAAAIGAQEIAEERWLKTLRRTDVEVDKQPRGYSEGNLSSDRRRAALALVGLGVALSPNDLKTVTHEIDRALSTDLDVLVILDGKLKEHPVLASFDRDQLFEIALNSSRFPFDRSTAISIVSRHLHASPYTEKMVIEKACQFLELATTNSSYSKAFDLRIGIDASLEALEKIETTDLIELGIYERLYSVLAAMSQDRAIFGQVKPNVIRATNKHYPETLAKDPSFSEMRVRNDEYWGIGTWPVDSAVFDYSRDFEGKIAKLPTLQVLRSPMTTGIFSLMGGLAGIGTVVGLSSFRKFASHPGTGEDSLLSK